jgi:hypothetical protein
MRTAIAHHELLPGGLYLESLSIQTGRVGIRVASGASKSRCPVCGLVSSRVHSRYSRGPREALLLRRALLREAHLLRAAAGRGRPRT